MTFNQASPAADGLAPEATLPGELPVRRHPSSTSSVSWVNIGRTQAEPLTRTELREELRRFADIELGQSFAELADILRGEMAGPCPSAGEEVQSSAARARSPRSSRHAAPNASLFIPTNSLHSHGMASECSGMGELWQPPGAARNLVDWSAGLCMHPIRTHTTASEMQVEDGDMWKRRRSSDCSLRTVEQIRALQHEGRHSIIGLDSGGAEGFVGHAPSITKPGAFKAARASARVSPVEVDGAHASMVNSETLQSVVVVPDARRNSGGEREQPTRARRAKTNLEAILLRVPETRSRMYAFVEHPLFGYFAGTAVCLNALLIGVQTQVASMDVKAPQHRFLFIAEWVFCLFFTAELLSRIVAYGREFFTMSGRVWNCFDCILVGLQILEKIFELIASDAGNASGGFSAMRILRVLRLVRIIRLVRVLRLIGELRTIVICIIGSLRPLAWTVALLMLLIYITGVYLTHMVSIHRLESGDAVGSRNLERYYNTLFRSCLTLFQSVMGGLSWNDAVAPLIEHIHPALGVVFALYVAFVLLAIMNVVTGVFVESAMATAQRDKDVCMVHHVRDLFKRTDVNHDGTVSWAEFEAQLCSEEMQDTLKLLDVDACSASHLFRMVDVEGSGLVSIEDFIDVFVRLRGPPRSLDLITVMYEHRRLAKQMCAQVYALEHALDARQKAVEAVGSPEPAPSS